MSDPVASTEAPTREQLLEALKVVIDPELGINVVDLGLVYDVTLDEGIVTLSYTLTTMGCPIGPMIEQQMQQVLTVLPGVNFVDARLTFDPPWTMECMSEEARLAMGMF
ncbi:MAG: metal-sulfur cluster assembly factor [Actinomycetota bacterium]